MVFASEVQLDRQKSLQHAPAVGNRSEHLRLSVLRLRIKSLFHTATAGIAVYSALVYPDHAAIASRHRHVAIFDLRMERSCHGRRRNQSADQGRIIRAGASPRK